jgi:hypothetical protein
MTEYNTKTYVMQRVLSANVDHSEKLQRHNLFQIFFIIKNFRIRTIIDGESCNNLLSADFMTKIGLMTCAHTHPYNIQWLNNSGKTMATHIARVHFSIGTYHDYADCDVVPMQACFVYWITLGSLILMLFIMVEVINILSCIRERKLLYFLLHQIKLCNVIEH